MTPAEIVFPPSLSANLNPLNNIFYKIPGWTAKGKLNLSLAVTLSPGVPILLSFIRAILTAVSAVLKNIYGLYPSGKGFSLPPSSAVSI